MLNLSRLLTRNMPAMTRQTKRIKTKRYKAKPIDPVSNQGVLIQDIKDLLKEHGIAEESAWNDMQAFFDRDRSKTPADHKVVQVKVVKLSSSGDGLGILTEDNGAGSVRTRVVVVPYTVVGDEVEAHIKRTEQHYLESQLLKVLKPGEMRNDDLIKCKYFAKCSGCQYQMVSYDNQLELKRQVIIQAYRHFAPKLQKTGRIPNVLDTVGSPLQFSYRTKLTPHFDRPPRNSRSYAKGDRPEIGFGIKASNDIIDIEECIIGTEAVNIGMKTERKNVLDKIETYTNGATILLREKQDETSQELVSYTSNPKEIITELVQDSPTDDGEARSFKFQYPAGSFFQNNNSILPLVTDYVRNNIKLPTGSVPKYLVDTYCGSGLFAVTCSPAVERVIGVEISQDSVKYAIENARLNDLNNAEFIVGQAEKIFERVDTPADETSIIIDPPRKGCDKAFLDQLIAFGPIKIVYVSCNVHSQARDLEYLLEKSSNYVIESIRGFDFFPQTHHVESVAVLRLNVS